MTAGGDPDALRRLLDRRVGAFFRNTVRRPGVTCTVCTGPATSTLCGRCRRHEDEFGDRLADHVVILTYVRLGDGSDWHQSAHTVWAYKERPPAPKCANDMALMIKAAETLHGDCIARQAGGPWTAITFVPSAGRPGASHPVANLARQIRTNNAAENRLLLDIGPGFDAQPARSVRGDRFEVPLSYLARVRDRHVLLIDDTWTTGSKAQSAAVTLHDAGAAKVTVLCVARGARTNGPTTRPCSTAAPSPTTR
ncbi:hypothetical protein EV193_10479 [Herbihabitans rhizosphaerae]|uniref:Amidophosphoribosyltransferase n=1 Tax=Herbihabitans rhizosphaerae TaxID=1872711 RepID=A0A4Q7KPY8_9PSEU|nr:hypothetical protein [Herbihabitans rhizosphaerae]RZS38868.1 hypothetical protein EV193_10479 [Herbihabitans rhizosphaerae]